MNITHYIKIAIRNIRKYKVQSLVGTFVLAFSLACFVLSFYWLHYETSYDHFYPDSDCIYRVYVKEKQSGKINKLASRSIENALRSNLSTVKSSTAIMSGQENCKTETVPYIQMNLLYVDSTFFSVFPQRMLLGDMNQSLLLMNNMVLTETTATRLFGSADNAIGKQIQNTIRLSSPPYIVTAVIKDAPLNSNLQFDAIVVHDMLRYFSDLPEEVQWNQFFMNLYIKLNPHTPMDELGEQIKDLGIRLGTNKDIELQMMPISHVHYELDSNMPFTLNTISLFVASGMLLLIASIFNFLNLHFSLFNQRRREFYMRSVNGATIRQLIKQMQVELFCSIFIALLAAGMLIALISPLFSKMLNIIIEIYFLFFLFTICGGVIIILIGLISFIAFYKLSYSAIKYQSVKKVYKQFDLNKVALMLQFTVSVVFLVATLIILLQVRFMERKDLGFDCKGLIQLSGFTDYSGKVENLLIGKLFSIPQVKNVTDTNFEPQHNANPFVSFTHVEWPGKTTLTDPTFHCIFTDHRFSETFQLRMKEGAWWKEGQTNKIVLNQEAVNVMELRDPVGSIIHIPSPDDHSVILAYEVIGVVNDFHTQSFRNHIQPTFFMASTGFYNILYCRVMSGYEWATMQQIIEFLPSVDITLSETRVSLASEVYDNLNRSEQTGSKILLIIACICLITSLFGIYAMVVSSCQLRNKEVAIRKVVGANVSDIIYLFFKEYILLVFLSGIIALPIAYLAMNYWLQSYAYRISISWYSLFSVVAVVILLVVMTVLGQVLRVANSNPAEEVKKNASG